MRHARVAFFRKHRKTMAQLRDNLLRGALMMVALGLLGGGIFLRQEHMDRQSREARSRKIEKNQEILLDQLRGKPLFRSGPTGSSHQRPEVALDVLRAAREAKIDPLACYHLSDTRDDLRYSLAYMLLLDANQEYLRYVETHLEEIPPGEVELWVTLLGMREDSLLAPATIRRIRQLALRSSTPPGLWFAAQRYQQAGLESDAETYMLRLLKSPSLEGVVAAKSLYDLGKHRKASLDYLWSLVGSESTPLAEEALRRLAQVLEATAWPEYKRYMVDASKANRSALLERLTEASTS
jgi:hypothetical protein